MHCCGSACFTYIDGEVVRRTIDMSNDRNALREMFQNEFGRHDGYGQSNDDAAVIAFEGKALTGHAARLNMKASSTQIRQFNELTLMMMSGCFDICTMGIPRNLTTFCRGSSVYSVQRVSTTFAPKSSIRRVVLISTTNTYRWPPWRNPLDLFHPPSIRP